MRCFNISIEYLLILILILVISLIFEIKYRIHLYHSLKERLVVTLNLFIVGLIWDYYAVYRKHWIYPRNGLIGIYIFGLPVEEFLFHLIIPYAILTAYKFWDKKIKK